ncbi:nicotinate (nicotinamide) nucleotide adenylyltransferase [Paracidobacterium acidisoli]|uniref:Probable nicotinate-nucleotide adenylyltransferase n=1 Tax=Paracidobacterium acidisoli TaxID=2303751 RepID=A0A372IL21_9BACT|nr:nicotinate (nicotinamide) nucleotide adenylyltransferase [Paracidobacterium acidisoli]MBT9332236.1 nicotinate (nicotinamide) nucleotide adenylyltransferase [Paracidobacterium acidisoli]
MNIALFGGTFDPPHCGHLALARLALARLPLDRVLLAPVGLQPLKRDNASAGFDDRAAMVRLAIAGDPQLELSLIDAPRLDGQPNYTIDTLSALRRTLSPQDHLYCLMGADSFLTIAKWRRSAELLSACDFIVGARPGFDLSRIAAALPEAISVGVADSGEAGPSGNRRDNSLVLSLSRGTGRRTHLYLLPDLAEDVSATEIRAAIGGDGDHPRQTVLAPAVLDYIHAHSLYQNPD